MHESPLALVDFCHERTKGFRQNQDHQKIENNVRETSERHGFSSELLGRSKAYTNKPKRNAAAIPAMM